MTKSAYLVQALQALDQQPALTQQQPGLSLQQLAQIGKDRKAFEAANPGQSYMGNGLRQMGQNLRQAPGNLMAAPGAALSGFGDLARSLAPR